MTIEVNGQPYELSTATTVHDLITEVAGSARGTAVIVDDEIVPRNLWRERLLTDGARIELITAVQGG